MMRAHNFLGQNALWFMCHLYGLQEGIERLRWKQAGMVMEERDAPMYQSCNF